MESPNFGAIRFEEPSVDTPMMMPGEAVVSEYTALYCLDMLSAYYDIRRDNQPTSDIVPTDPNSLPISRVIGLAGDLGFSARYLFGDWRWLQMEVSFGPTLLVLKNTNVVVAIANGSGGSEEIVIRDPLHRNAETIVLSRKNIERAWDGDLLIIRPQPERSEKSDPRYGETESDRSQQSWSVQTQRPGKPLKSTGHQFGRTDRRPPITALLGVLAALSLALFAGTSGRWAPEKTAPAPQAAKQISEKSLSSGAIPLLETPEKKSRAAPPELTNPGSALVDRPSIATLPLQETQPESSSVAEGQRTTAESDLPPVNRRSSGVTPSEQPVTIQPNTGAQPSGSQFTTAHRPEVKQEGPSSTPALTADESAALLARGDDYLRMDDVASARLFYQRASDAGWANGALRLGETFDPAFLSRAQIYGVAGDMEKAIFWYRQARELGSTDAAELLKQLDGPPMSAQPRSAISN